MFKVKLNAFLFVVFVLLAIVNLVVGRDFSKPNVVLFSNYVYSMMRSIPFNALSPNPYFDNGATLQTPPENTIARGRMPLHYQPTEEDAQRAGRELSNPVAEPTQDVISRGRVVYNNYCLPCHGASGAGDGPVAQRGYPPPPPLTAENAINMKDGQIFHILTYGQGNMPRYAPQISREDRWKVITYLRTMQEGESNNTESMIEAEAEAEAEAETETEQNQ